MYLNIVIIDCLGAQGVLTTYRITPVESRGRVVIDRLTDIQQDIPSLSISGARVYNLSSCQIEVQIRVLPWLPDSVKLACTCNAATIGEDGATGDVLQAGV